MNKVEQFHPSIHELIEPEAELLLAADGFQFTEGPLWDASSQALLFSDIKGNTIYAYHGEERVATYRKPSHFSNGLAYDPDGHLVACEHQTRRISRQIGEDVEVVVDRFEGKRFNSPNDVIVSKNGSILFTDPTYGLREGLGGPAEQELDFQGVFLVSPGSSLATLLADDYDAPNGLMLNHDESILYINDTKRMHIRRYGVGKDWNLSGGEAFITYAGEKPGKPDGMKLDSLGNIYCTGPGGIWINSPEGEALGCIMVPERTSNIAWGGQNFKTLFITAGSRLYRINCLVPGAK